MKVMRVETEEQVGAHRRVKCTFGLSENYKTVTERSIFPWSGVVKLNTTRKLNC